VTHVPSRMWAIRLHSPGGPEGLVHERIETPQPGAEEVLVRVHAAAITRDELDWPVDRLPAIPSYEFSGTAAGVGSGVLDVAIGDPVYALHGFDRDGAAAEYTVLPKDMLAPKPTTIGHIESAAIPLAALSAWQGLFDHGKLGRGQRVLIHGAAGGVGGFAVQLARRVGAYVIGTVSTKNVEAARRLGVDQVIDRTRVAFEDAVEEVDLVFDTAGGENLKRSPAILRSGGRLVSVVSEPPTERGIETVYFVVEPNRDQLIELAGSVDVDGLRPTLDEVFPLMDARKAFERSLGEHGSGKIVLQVADG
jgi:NADPH:quinone reductase-like Zn-dependent oxidoreductase